MSTSPLKNSDNTSLEFRISNDIKYFDLLAILRLLEYLEYDTIWFESNDSLVSETHIIHRIQFKNKIVILTLNIGLLSPQSPLPNYMMQLRESYVDKSEEFAQFIRFFDHTLISDYIKNYYPQLNHNYFKNWKAYQNLFLKLSNIKSLRSIHFIFKSIYPEFNIICKAINQHKLEAAWKTRLGQIKLGKAYHLGDVEFNQFSGISIKLHETENKISIDEMRSRFNALVMPIFSMCNLFLDVKINGTIDGVKINSPKASNESSNQNKLGFHKLLKKRVYGELTLYSDLTFQREKTNEN